MQRQSDLDSENHRAQNTALQAYLDLISHLLLEKRLRSDPENDSPTVAQARTIALLLQLDRKDWNQKGVVVHFLYKAGLVCKEDPVISLAGASLRYANLECSDLGNINLSGADLYGANLAYANLGGADFSNSNLSDAGLNGACLSTARLRGASLIDARLIGADLWSTDLASVDLKHANLSNANLEGASLAGATLAGATLVGASLRRTDLSQAWLGGADLRETKDLMQEQIGQGIGDPTTQLPQHVRRPDTWMKYIEKQRQSTYKGEAERKSLH